MESVITIREAFVAISQLFLPMTAANAMFLDEYDREGAPDRLPKMQDQTSLTLHWRSISEWGMECVAFSFAYNGSQYIHYALQLPNQFLITWLRRPEINHVHFKVIVAML